MYKIAKGLSECDMVEFCNLTSVPFYRNMDTNSDIIEEKHYLNFVENKSMQNSMYLNSFRFFTYRSDIEQGGKVFMRYLNIYLCDKNKSLYESPYNLEYYIEVWHKYDHELVVYPNNKSVPLLCCSIKKLYEDPLQLPAELGAEFYVKIVAKGMLNKNKKYFMKPNFKLKVEKRGHYSRQSESINTIDTRIAPGTTRVLANGKID